VLQGAAAKDALNKIEIFTHGNEGRRVQQ
jgi:hypothetical protein